MSKCQAWVSEPPHYFHGHRCEKRAREYVLGRVPVCGTHARVARKWSEQGRLGTMVEHWWKVKP